MKQITEPKLEPMRLPRVMTPKGEGILIGQTADGRLVVIRPRPAEEMDKAHGPTFPPEFWLPAFVDFAPQRSLLGSLTEE